MIYTRSLQVNYRSKAGLRKRGEVKIRFRRHVAVHLINIAAQSFRLMKYIQTYVRIP